MRDDVTLEHEEMAGMSQAMRWRAERDAARQELGRLKAENSALRERAMPEGMEWPRFEDGEPVRIGGEFALRDDGEVFAVRAFTIEDDSFDIISDEFSEPYNMGERVKRPAPKVLDADGVEIRMGDTVWPAFPDPDPRNQVERAEVVGIHAEVERVDVRAKYATGMSFREQVNADQLTHRAPVLAADGKPLSEGEHVWHAETGTELVVKRLPKPGEYQSVVVFAPPASHLTSFDPDRLTHERPDSWERLEEDATLSVNAYRERRKLEKPDGMTWPQAVRADIVRRARKMPGEA